MMSLISIAIVSMSLISIAIVSMMSLISIAIVKYSTQNCLNAVKDNEMDDDTIIVNLTMLNINAICKVLFFIYIPYKCYI